MPEKPYEADYMMQTSTRISLHSIVQGTLHKTLLINNLPP